MGPCPTIACHNLSNADSNHRGIICQKAFQLGFGAYWRVWRRLSEFATLRCEPTQHRQHDGFYKESDMNMAAHGENMPKVEDSSSRPWQHIQSAPKRIQIKLLTD